MSHQSSPLVRSTPTLSYVEYAILLTILHEAKYSVEIFEQIAQMTNEQLILDPDTLYTALKQLYCKHLIELVPTPTPTAADHTPVRRRYLATEAGRAEIVEIRDWMDHQITMLDAVIETLHALPADVAPS